MTTIATHPPRSAAPLPALRQIVCAVHDGRGSADAVREALGLAGCAERLRFVSVFDGAEAGDACLGERRARLALAGAQALTAQRGVRGEAELVDDPDVAAGLLARSGERDLLVAGTQGNAPLAGIATGSVTTALAHNARGSLLVARPSRGSGESARRMLVAVDDSRAAVGVVRLAAQVAAGCGGYVHLVHVQGGDYGSHTRHRLAELSLAVIALSGHEPVVDVLRGVHVAVRIMELAERSASDLLVVGRRGQCGAGGLGAVSERLVHEAPCSVLVAGAREIGSGDAAPAPDPAVCAGGRAGGRLR